MQRLCGRLWEAVPYENLSIGRSSERSFQLIYFVAENLLSVFNFLSYIYVKFHVVTESSLYTLSAGVIHTAKIPHHDCVKWSLTRHSQMSQNHVASHMHWNLDYALLICDCHYCDCLELPMFVLKLNL